MHLFRASSRLWAMTIAAIGAVSVVSASPVAAFPLPQDSSYVCENEDAGYVGSAGPNPDATGLTFLGTLRWQMCVLVDAFGRKHSAKVQLSSKMTADKNDRFFGVIEVRLQACLPFGAKSQLAYVEGDYDGSPFDLGVENNGRYLFDVLQTGWSTTSAPQYRVKVTTYAGQVIPSNGGAAIYLSSAGQNGSATFTTPCWTI